MPVSDARAVAEQCAPDRLARGDRLGRYVIRNELHVGPMGTVYAAYDPELDRAVAIKLLHPHATADAEAIRRSLLREAQAAAHLTHPNVVTIHDVGTARGRVFVAMELLSGPPLREWMQRPHHWREVVRMLLPAGAALAAAHAAGIVHRDFKPENVMFGAGGRVVVTDFGLARHRDEVAAVDPGFDTFDTHEGAGLETTGALGTPAYAAPEQLTGGRVDARSDQYSFCVVLYEALHGHRPAADCDAVTSNGTDSDEMVIPETAAPARIPGWLDEVLARGLAIEPGRRHRDMPALLSALNREQRSRHRIPLLALAGAVAAGGTTLAISRTEPSPASYCDRIDEHLAGAWDADRQGEIEAALLATGEPAAADAWKLVQSRFHAFAVSWVTAATSACQAHLGGVSPTFITALRMACLNRQVGSAAALSDALRNADARTVLHAGELLSDLPEATACDDDTLLVRRASARAEIDPVVQRELDDLLSQADARHRVADFAGALALSRQLLARAQQVGDRWAIADGLIAAALNKQWLQRGEVQQDLHDAFSAALAAEHHEAAANAIIGLLAEWSIDTTTDLTQVEHWLAHGRAAIAALGGHAGLEATIEGAIGNVYHRRGRLQDAQAAYYRALSSVQGGAYLALHGAAYGNLGVIAAAQGRAVDALALLRRSHEVLLEVHGPLHPMTASALINVGSALANLGDLDGAAAAHRDGLEVLERNFGPTHPSVAPPLRMLASDALARRQFAEALPWAERANAITAVSETDGESRARSTSMLAAIHLGMGQVATAVTEAETALAVATAALGDDHPSLAEFDIDLGLALTQARRYDEALQRFQAAISTRTRTIGGDDPEIVRAWQGIAELELARGHAEAARGAASRALELASTPGFQHDPARHEARFLLARVLQQTDRAPNPRARTLAEEAYGGFAAAGTGWVAQATEVAAWLAKHPAS